MNQANPRLHLHNVCTSLQQGGKLLPLVRGVSLSIHDGETLALVGESGSGKSLTALTIMRLLARNANWQVSGEILLQDASHQTLSLLQLPAVQMQALRGHQLAMIFQEPMTCLNPVMHIGAQIEESVRLHLKLQGASARAHALRMLEQVEIPDAKTRINDYPHQLSGGMRQRVMIALAMACNPRVLIADEPTTALDVTVQAQILALLAKLQQANGMALLFITHNLGLVAHHADRVAVMYAGQMVEQASVADLFDAPLHPYTQGLLGCLPGRARVLARQLQQRVLLQDIPGQVPAMDSLPAGCAFADRCPKRFAACSQEAPWQTSTNHAVRCHLPPATPL
ncbi:MAG: ABC transporter ATP-binding protein [Gammaproteobacteria bacterium]|nr:ABC transporter ATP-binding protein [Gammaproteobacteria bacterium]